MISLVRYSNKYQVHKQIGFFVINISSLIFYVCYSQIHFEENHSKEDQAFVQSLKDLFGKAKKKILSEDEVGLDSLPKVSKLSVASTRLDNVHPVSGMRTDVPQFTPAQPNTSHFIQFKSKDKNKIICILYIARQGPGSVQVNIFVCP